MPGALTADQIATLRVAVNNDTAGNYYALLASYGDPYGTLAGGVVGDEGAGAVARAFAEATSKDLGYAGPSNWHDVSVALMRADFAIRESAPSTSLTLTWDQIRDYHVSVFQTQNMPAEAWTAYVPLQVDESLASNTWSRMLNEADNYLAQIKIGFDVVADTSLAHKVGIAYDIMGNNRAALLASLQEFETSNSSMADRWVGNMMLSRAFAAQVAGETHEGQFYTPLGDGLGWFIAGRGVSVAAPVLSWWTNLINGEDRDTLQGESLSDEISGYSGDDRLIGGAGADALHGASGSDTLVGGAGGDALFGGTGGDLADYSDFASGRVFNFDRFNTGNVYGAKITATGDDADTLLDIEKVRLTTYSDRLDLDDSFAIEEGGLFNGVGIDGGGHEAGGYDEVNLSQLTSGVYLKNNNIDGAKLALQNFDKFTLTAHDDTIASNVTGAFIDAGQGNDVIKGAGLGSLIYTGDGDDKVYFSPGIGVADLSTTDRISLGGVLNLYGGLRNKDASPEDPYATSFGGLVQWGKNEAGELVIRMPWWNYSFIDNNGNQQFKTAEMYVLNWKNTAKSYVFGGEIGPGNIVLAEYDMMAVNIKDDWPSGYTVQQTWELFGLFTKTITGRSAWKGIDPLVVDLDGDGLELRGQTSVSPAFDIDADLYAERTGWVQRDDGILVRDLNGDSVIGDSSEMFGGTTSGFDVLAALDGNHDGVVNASDNGLADFNKDGTVNGSDTFAALKIWKDEDGDARTDAGELHALNDYNIVGISLTTTEVDQTNEANLVTRTSTFIKGDASTGIIGDVVLRVDNSNTNYLGAPITITPEAASAPDLKGFGTLVDLRQALSLRPELIATVEAALDGVTGPDIAAIRAAVLPALTAWAQGSPIRLANGTIVSGEDGVPNHANIPVFADGGEILDYAWKTEADEVLVGGQTRQHGVWNFVSGAEVEVTAALSSPLPNLSSLPANGAGPTVTASTVIIGGENYTRHAFITAAGDEVTVTWKASSDEPVIADALVGTTGTGAWDTVLGAEVGFMERYLGEILPFSVEPDDTEAALQGLRDALDNMDQTLDLLGVRLAVQIGGLASIFAGIDYDAGFNGFYGSAGQQLTPVYEQILTLANGQTDPVAYMEAWKPILDVIIGDFSQGEVAVLNTYGFLAQNIIGAFEAVDPAFSLAVAAEALGFPPELLVTGSGAMTGSNDADIFYLDSSDQTAAGGAGPDTYVIGAQMGHDVINDVEPPLTGQVDDIVRFTTIDADDVTATRDGLDLVLTVDSTSETLRIVNQFTGVWPGFTGGNFWDDNGVGRIVFADGESWSKLDMARAVSRPATGLLEGTEALDVLETGSTDDTLAGKGGSDLYLVGRGGHDVIHEGESNQFREAMDVVSFDTEIGFSDIALSRNGDDLIVGFYGSEDTLTVHNQFTATQTGVFGTWWFDQIELFTFRDGSMLSNDDVMAILLRQSQSDGDDVVLGFHVNDTLDGGGGNDFLSGGDGDDTYRFGLDYGHDTISEALDNLLSGVNDRVQFGPGIDADDVTFAFGATKDDLLVTLSDGSTIDVVGQFHATFAGFVTVWFNRIENFEFFDGETIGWSDVLLEAIANQKTPGDDTIYGSDLGDTLEGGTGDDLLIGGNGEDTYVFGRGDGADTIDDQQDNILSGEADALTFKSDIAPADLVLTRGINPADLVISVLGTSDSVTIKGEFPEVAFYAYGVNQVEELRFSDSTAWDVDDIKQQLLLDAKTSGDDLILGFAGGDTVAGGAGNDTLIGGDGADTYRFARGDGQDLVDDRVQTTFSATDVVEFQTGISASHLIVSRVGDDMILTLKDPVSGLATTDQIRLAGQFDTWSSDIVEQVRFVDAPGVVLTANDLNLLYLANAATSGDDNLVGTQGADTLNGLGGDDTMQGGDGNDVYLFDVGHGSDVIHDINDNQNISSQDTVRFATGIDPADVHVVRDGSNAIFSVTGHSETLTVVGYFGSGFEHVETIAFVDSSTTWNYATVLAKTLGYTPGDDSIVGDAGANTLQGGQGNDTIYGAEGDDKYLYNVGDGHDKIYDNFYEGTGDKLQFGAGLESTDVVIVRDGDHATLSFAGQTGSVYLDKMFAGFWAGPDELIFADSVSWGHSDLEREYLERVATPGNDGFGGFGGAETLEGGQGDDTLYGLGGEDVYVYNLGDGQDRVYEGGFEGYTDTVKLGAGITPASVTVSRIGDDIKLTFADGGSILLQGQLNGHWAGVESVTFTDTTVWDTDDMLAQLLAYTPGPDNIVGDGGANTLQGGGGNDTLSGQGSDDVYVYNLGDGQDRVYEGGFEGYSDTVKLGAGITPASVTVSRIGDDIKLTFADGGSILLQGQLNGHWAGVESVTFADTTVWDTDDMLAQLLAYTPGPDNIVGDGGSNTLQGGGGNDTLSGQGSDDVYVYNLGDGEDRIYDGGFEGWADQLKLGTGITPDSIVVNNAWDDVKIYFQDGGSILLQGQNNGHAAGIESISFANGTTWSTGDIYANFGPTVYAGTSGSDSIAGSTGSDSLRGGAGADTLAGGDGVDWLAGGAGNDVLDGGNGADTAVFIGALADYTISAGSTTTVTHTATGEVDTLSNIESLKFSDQTISAVAGQTLIGTSGADTLTGGSGADCISGGAGWDRLTGGDGADTIVLDWGDTVSGGAGDDRLVFTSNGYASIDGGSGNDTLAVEPGGGYIAVVALSGVDVIDGTGGSNVFIRPDSGMVLDLSAISLINIASIATNAGSETMIGSAGADTFTSYLGSDSFSGGGGDDLFIVQDASPDYYDGGLGNDTVSGSGQINVQGLVGIEAVTSSTAGGSIVGTSGADTIDLTGTTLTNITAISGGDGNDLFKIGAGTPALDMTGDLGNDTIAASANNVAIGLRSVSGVEAITAGGYTGVTIVGSSGADVLDLSGATLTGIGSVDAGGGADSLAGSASADLLKGGDGADSLSGGAGNDTLEGGDGTDTAIFSGALADYTISWGSTTTVTRTSTGEVDTLLGFENFKFSDQTVSSGGGAAAQTLIGTSGADTLTGGSGADCISGGAGWDKLTGGDGADTIVLDWGDTVSGGAGDDRLVFTSNGYASIDGGSGNDTLAVEPGGGYIAVVALSGVDVIDGTGGSNVFIRPDSGMVLDLSAISLINIASIATNAGSETMIGSAGADTFTSYLGSDSFSGGGGDDLFIVQDASPDYYDGGLGNDTVSGSGQINVQGLVGIEAVTSSTAGGSIVGTSGADTIDLTGTTLTNITAISGGDGNDSVRGAAVGDVISGQSGNDTIDGGGGQDTLYGDAGADVFRFTSLSGSPASTADVIQDFVQGTDLIDLSAIDANFGLSSDQAFSWIGASAFSSTAGELRVNTGISGKTIILGDVDGDGTADFAVELTGSVTLSSASFAL